MFNLWEIQSFYKNTKKEEWEKVIKTIVLNDQKKISVVLEGLFEGSSLEYYIRRMNLEERVEVYYLNDFNHLRTLIEDKKYIWLIHTGDLNLSKLTNDHHIIDESFSHTKDQLQLVKLKVQ